MSFLRNVFETLGTRVLSMAFTMVRSVAVARALGPEMRGVLALVRLVPTLAYSLLNLGAGAATTYHVARRDVPVRDVLLRVALLLAGTGVVAAVATGWIVRNASAAEARYAGVAVALAVTSFAFAWVAPTLAGLKRFRVINGVALAAGAANLAGTLALWATGRLGVASYLLLNIAVTVVAAAWQIAWLRRHGHLGGGETETEGISVSAVRWRPLLAYGIGIHANNIAWLLILRSDQVFVRVLRTPMELGLYSVSANLAEMLRALPMLAGTVLFPYAVAMQPEERRRFLSTVSASVLAATLLLAMVLAPVADIGVRLLYGDEYAGAALPFVVLLFGVALLTVHNVTGYQFVTEGKPHVNSLINGAGLAVNAGLNLLLIPPYGITGAAVASLVAYALISAITVWVLAARRGYSVRALLVPRPGDARALLRMARTRRAKPPAATESPS